MPYGLQSTFAFIISCDPPHNQIFGGGGVPSISLSVELPSFVHVCVAGTMVSAGNTKMERVAEGLPLGAPRVAGE